MRLKELLFIGLNVADAYLSGVGIRMGSHETLPWSQVFSSSMLAKGLVALAIVLGLYWFGREKSLWWMNIIVFGACAWNFSICSVSLLCGILWG